MEDIFNMVWSKIRDDPNEFGIFDHYPAGLVNKMSNLLQRYNIVLTEGHRVLLEDYCYYKRGGLRKDVEKLIGEIE